MTHVMETLKLAILNGRVITKEDKKMNNTIEALKVRMHKLQQRDPVGNAKIVAKLKRRIRAMEK